MARLNVGGVGDGGGGCERPRQRSHSFRGGVMSDNALRPRSPYIMKRGRHFYLGESRCWENACRRKVDK